MLSFVIPVFNEEESLPHFYKELVSEIVKTTKDYEIIFVDDGSTDTTLQILKDLLKKDKNIRIFSFRANRGKAEALTLGFSKVKGEFVVTMDADLQDLPEELPKFIVKQKEGFDCVSGWRKDRKDKPHMIVISKVFNFTVKIFWGLRLHDYNCGFKFYTKEAAQSLNLYGGRHRFIPLLLSQQGFKVGEIQVHHQKRLWGKSKYGFGKIFKDIPDMFTIIFLSKYARRPMHFFGLVGGILFLSGLLTLVYLTLVKIGGESIGGRPLLFLGMLLVISGLQVFFTGFLADFILNMNQQLPTSKDEKTLIKYSSEQ